MLSRSPLFRLTRSGAADDCAGRERPARAAGGSRQMVEALRSRGISVEYLLFEDEGHGFARPEEQASFSTPPPRGSWRGFSGAAWRLRQRGASKGLPNISDASILWMGLPG